jgi:hypothetical protein
LPNGKIKKASATCFRFFFEGVPPHQPPVLLHEAKGIHAASTADVPLNVNSEAL